MLIYFDYFAHCWINQLVWSVIMIAEHGLKHPIVLHIQGIPGSHHPTFAMAQQSVQTAWIRSEDISLEKSTGPMCLWFAEDGDRSRIWNGNQGDDPPLYVHLCTLYIFVLHRLMSFSFSGRTCHAVASSISCQISWCQQPFVTPWTPPPSSASASLGSKQKIGSNLAIAYWCHAAQLGRLSEAIHSYSTKVKSLSRLEKIKSCLVVCLSNISNPLQRVVCHRAVGLHRSAPIWVGWLWNIVAEAKRCHILCMSAVAAGLVAKSRLFGASFAGAARGISSRNALRPGGD